MILLRVKLTFIEEVLGSASAEVDVHRKFIASKAPDAPNRSEKIKEEIEAIGLDNAVENKKTIFPKLEDGSPFMWDYQMKGMFKNAAKAMAYIGGDKKLTAYKSKIDDLVFIKERKIPYHLPKGAGIGSCQRPLRASTMQGERVTLASSETIPEGSYVEMTIKILDDTLKKHVIDWLDYGELNGLGQWHNSGKGRFTYEILDEMKMK